MKNKNLLIGLAVAVLGTAATVATAYSLYKETPADITINIGARTNKDIVCSIQNLAWKDGNSNLQPGANRDLEFTLGWEKTIDSTYTQNVMVGRLTVEISSTNADFVDYYAERLSSEITYDEGTFFAGENRNVSTSYKSEGKIVITGQYPIHIDGQKCTLNFDTPANIAKADMLAIAGADFTVNINWEEADDYNYAYVASNLNEYGETEEYRMVPNTKSANFEWMYKLDAAHKALFVEGTEFKCRQTPNGATEAAWSRGDNFVVSADNVGKIDSIYWSGSSEADMIVYIPE